MPMIPRRSASLAGFMVIDYLHHHIPAHLRDCCILNSQNGVAQNQVQRSWCTATQQVS
uniref:Uncharacterized protein n=1 Tax=Arundo donax TaxID=35708 RepID=A0A0A9HU47_ARUDO